MSFVKNIVGKFPGFGSKPEGDAILEDATSSDDYEEKGAASSAKGIFDDDDTSVDNIKYSPTSAFSAPEFDAFAPSSSSRTAEVSATKKTAEKAAGPHLYDLNAARSQPKFKLNFISLHDIYDAKNVANLMIERDTIIVVNIANLADDEKRRAMDFLDGAKYVSKSVFARFTDTICAFIPEEIELHGDFYGQVEIASFDDRNF